MRVVVQVVSALLLAVGVGLLALGATRASLAREFGDPTDSGRNNRTEQQYAEDRRTEAARYVERASVLQGCGAALATLGAVGLLAPWVSARV